MRLQLAWRLAPLLIALAGAAHADSSVAGRVTLFHEPSRTNDGVTVLHPQVDGSGQVSSSVRVNLGYDADIVSGATPVVYGPTAGPDAVTGATRFSDQRHSVRGGFDYTSGPLTLGGAYAYARESDYRSHAFTIAARGDLFERNLTLGLSYTRNFDQVCNANNTMVQTPLELRPLTSSTNCFAEGRPEVVTEGLDIHTLEPTLTWTATPRLLLVAGGTLQALDGFQSNPYRSVLVGSQHRTPQENEPRQRQRYAAFVRALYAFPKLRASASLSGRAYRDSWGIEAGSLEADFQKYLGTFLLLRLRGRYHQQTGAVFYRTSDEYRSSGPAGRFWTGDRELSPMGTILVGGKLSYLRSSEQGLPMLSFLEQFELAIKFDWLHYLLDTPNAPNADRDHAIIMQTALILGF